MLLKPMLGELMKIVLVRDRRLCGKNGAAEIVGELRADLLLDVTRVNCSLEGPDVCRDGKVMAQQRNVELPGGLALQRMGASAGGTSQVLKDDDCDLAASGRAQDCGVAEVVVLRRAEELGVQRGRGETDCDYKNAMRNNLRINVAPWRNGPEFCESRSSYSSRKEVHLRGLPARAVSPQLLSRENY